MDSNHTSRQSGLDELIGRTALARDIVSTHRIAALAATLDTDAPADGTVPPLWHWVLFQDWQKWSTLGADGHVARGAFMPAIEGMERRMWAGSAIRFHRSLRVGEEVERRSTITGATLKQGRTGALAFIQLRHDIGPPGETAITEVQDVVYRAADDPAVSVAPPEPIPPTARTRTVMPDALTLFRYSAVTGNSHRIHYDHEYVTGTEHYPGLVVQGALQATWLADFARACRDDAPIHHFEFRARRAAFQGKPLTLSAILGDTGLDLALRDAGGAVCMVGAAR
ncbi:FAS1-like dehydratase domain-containing protein [Acidiphilium sp.]|uniref:FAS1-like dehydratase domain-containing protein n=1 Tax=Acidiphilium sp. TaxID=527 RepID=UPI003CFC8443